MSTSIDSTVATHPAFADSPVANEPSTGRKPGTLTLNFARRRRTLQQLQQHAEAAAPGAADAGATDWAPPRRGRFHYPAEYLRQAQLCRGTDGVWRLPRFSLESLGSPDFKSPLLALLEQLEAEGHDISAARIEAMALRELGAAIEDDFLAASHAINRLGNRKAFDATTLYARALRGEA